jgi:hypothetical protein
VATGIFVGIVAVLGGPAIPDTSESVYSTWAIAHGQLSCAFPSAVFPHEPLLPPLYPLFSGALTAIADLGRHAAPFPSRAAMGPNCDTAFVAMRQWAGRSGALIPTIQIGYSGWLVLMGGLVAWLRASGRGRCGWEPATVVVVACLPPVWMCVEGYFHPQDLFAMGFSLGALACARKGRWAGAGVLIALAVLSQQFALLVAVPLLVLAPGARRLRYAGTAVGTATLIAVPLLVVSSGSAWRALTLGSGDNPSLGGTAVWELGLNGAAAVLVSRVLPIALALAIPWWVVRRLGPARFEPVALLSLVAVCLSLRLVFEQNLFVYYFMALAVSLVLLDVARGHIRSSLVAWLVALTLVFCIDWFYSAFSSVPWGNQARVAVPAVILALVLVLVLFQVVRGGGLSPWNVVLCTGVVASGLLTWSRSSNPFYHHLPIWLWQVVFVASGIALAAGPLLDRVAEHKPATERPEPAPA